MAQITKNLIALGLMALCSAPQAMAVGFLDLAALETRFFAHPYDKESASERLNRLEERVFGETQKGSTQERLARLDQAIKDISPPAVATSAPLSTAPRQKADELMKSQSQQADELMKQPSHPRQMLGGSSTYPAVTDLERSILGKTFYGDSVQQRLDRLETKAYGKPTQIQDLATRVDKLTSYANVYGMHDNSDPLGNLVGRSASASDNGIIDKVAALENTMYGQVSTDSSLLKRVSGLEQSVFGTSLAYSGSPLRNRVDHLWASVKRPSSAPSTPQPAQTAQSMAPFSSSTTAWNNQNPSQDWNNQNPAPVPSQLHKHHSSFLKKIGQVVVFAGSAAISAGSMAAGSMGGGYGYGGGYGFSSFTPYGFGGMGSFGGIRSYGNGISNGYAMMQTPQTFFSP